MTISSLLPEANGWGEKRLMGWGDRDANRHVSASNDKPWGEKRLTAMLVLQVTNTGVRRG